MTPEILKKIRAWYKSAATVPGWFTCAESEQELISLVEEAVKAERDWCKKIVEECPEQGDYYGSEDGSYWESSVDSTRREMVRRIEQGASLPDVRRNFQ